MPLRVPCPRRLLLSAAAVAAIAFTAGCTRGDDTTSSDSDLIGGAVPSTLPPGIVALHVPCTATKIGARELLTAGHCVVRRSSDVDAETSEVRGTFARGEPMCIYPAIRAVPDACVPVTIAKTTVHPSFVEHVKRVGVGGLNEGIADVAVIRVEEDTAAIPIATLATRSLGAGSPVRMSGYGCTSFPAPPDSERTLRTGRTVVDRVGDAMFFTGMASGVGGCPGDSGGPAYLEGADPLEVVGVNSFIVPGVSTAIVRLDVGTAARSWVDAFVGQPRASALPVAPKDVRILASGRTFMPGAFFHDGTRAVALGAALDSGHVVATQSTDLASFMPAQELPWTPLTSVTGARAGERDTLYFQGAIDARAALYRSNVSFTADNVLIDPPTAVTISGTSVAPSWPQAVGLRDGRTLLAFVEAQSSAYLAIDDGGGRAFVARPWPNVTGQMRGVLAHVGTTTRGSWVITHQVADASWMFTSLVQLSRDGGTTWSRPANIQPDDPNIHDAFPIARRDAGADLYYLRGGPRNEFNVHRRALHEDGTLGAEELVTAPEVGHTEKPQPRRLPDGRIALMFAVRRGGDAYDLAVTVLDGDASP